MPSAPNPRRRYYVATWDSDRQEFTPQKGVRTGPYSLFGLRRAIRALRRVCGYDTNYRSCDPFGNDQSVQIFAKE